MKEFKFTVLAIDENKRPKDSKHGFSFEASIQAVDEDEARKVGIELFMAKHPGGALEEYVTDIST